MSAALVLGADTFLWQTFASVVIPGYTIRITVSLVTKMVQQFSSNSVCMCALCDITCSYININIIIFLLLLLRCLMI